MLTHLFIQNFTIIDTLDLTFDAGMTVITGETGAGKSIMIDALALILGARAENQVIRHGETRCEIIATFDLSNAQEAQHWLTDQALENETECFIRRIISSDGKSKSFINGRPVPLQALRELGSMLVNIHGQHEHQNLLQRNAQRELLDAYGEHEIILKEINEIYQQWHKLHTEIEAKQQQVKDRETRQAFLTFQVQEFDALDVTREEIINLDQEHKNLANAEQRIQQCQQALVLLDSAEQNAITQLEHAKHIIQSFHNSSLNELLQNAIINTQEAIDEIQTFLANLEVNPERLIHIEQRITKIHDIARKHRIKPEEIPALHQQLKEELINLQDSDIALEKLKAQLIKSTQDYAATAKQLTKKRQQAAKKMAHAIEEHMQTLGMPGGRFAISLEALPKESFTAYGAEKIEFLVSANPGQPLQPLTKVASGGELSRISLAIQVIAAANQNLPTLIFDEVDVGIGGSTAAIVGKLIRQLAQNAQIFCVTHLPQVAAQGQHHFQVQKNTTPTSTHTQIKKLTKDERVQEIARMLGGLTITKQTLASAKELMVNS